MMNEKYLDFLKEAKEIELKAKDLLKIKVDENFENNRAHEVINYIKSELSDAVYELELLSKNTKEGILLMNSQGRFNLDSEENIYFTCGSPIELFIEGQWHQGRVENKDNRYYFYDYDEENVILEEGMKARIRVDKK